MSSGAVSRMYFVTSSVGSTLAVPLTQPSASKGQEPEAQEHRHRLSWSHESFYRSTRVRLSRRIDGDRAGAARAIRDSSTRRWHFERARRRHASSCPVLLARLALALALAFSAFFSLRDSTRIFGAPARRRPCRHPACPCPASSACPGNRPACPASPGMPGKPPGMPHPRGQLARSWPRAACCAPWPASSCPGILPIMPDVPAEAAHHLLA